jgi:Bacterial PH domain
MRRRAEQSTFYRNRVANFLVWAMTAFAALYFLTEMVSALGDALNPAAVGIDASLMIVFLVPAVRFPRHGVVTSPSGIVVRNILRTHVLHWDEVERFEIASDFVTNGGVAVLFDGRRIPMTGINQGFVGHCVAETVAALNEELRRQRHGSRRGERTRELAEDRQVGV